MEQIHGHEVLQMMKGHSYSESSLRKAIIDRWGAHQLFYTCSADNLSVDDLILFFKEHGKFMFAGDGFTVDVSQICDHER